ncbi:hypothetical protein BpHYR1_028350 [Brachionus plicatilis]|uniref:Uncharacterized protein n=1 Tax=Brachionus plicatilis TaxID=10195 RepID=A0A3M7P526_BRAPC|nr:hypothetical protein BpHYR1_028350 [Brachionus plicatilis]
MNRKTKILKIESSKKNKSNNMHRYSCKFLILKDQNNVLNHNVIKNSETSPKKRSGFGLDLRLNKIEKTPELLFGTIETCSIYCRVFHSQFIVGKKYVSVASIYRTCFDPSEL